MGRNIFSDYQMPELQKKLVKSALKNNKGALLKKIHKYPYKPIKGFRKIDLLPEKLLIDIIIEYAESFTEVSNIILKIWFESEIILRERVRNELTNLGYVIHQPDFEDSGIEWDTLNENDILVIQDIDGGSKYFAPNGKCIDGFEPTDVTLMSIIFGWFDDSCKEAEENLSNGTTNEAEDENPNIIETDNSEDAEESIVGEPESIEATEDKGNEFKITDNFLILDKEYIQYSSDKYSYTNTLRSVIDDLDKDIFQSELNINPSIYKNLSDKNNELITLSKSIKSELVSYVKYINNKYNLNIELSDYKDNEADVGNLKNDISALQATLSPILITSQTKMKNQFDNIDQFDKVDYLNKLDEISFDIKENKIENFENTMSKIDYLSKVASIIQQENELNFLTSSFVNFKTEKSYRKIFKYFISNSVNDDLFVFLYASCKDSDVEPYIDCVFNDHIDKIISVLTKLFLKHGDKFVVDLIEDFDLIKPIISNEEGKKFVILLSIYLHLINQRELATTHLWDIKKSFEEYNNIKQLIERILYGEEIIFSKFDAEFIKKKSRELNEIFVKEGGRYKKITSVQLKVLKDILNDNIYPYLEKLKDSIASAKSKDELVKYESKISDDSFATELYEESAKEHDINSHIEEFIKSNSIKEIEEIMIELMDFINIKKEEINSSHLPNVKGLKQEFNLIITSTPSISIIADKIIDLLEKELITAEIEKLDLRDYIVNTVLNSDYYAFNFTNICCTLVENEIEDLNLLTIILKDANANRDINEVIEMLKEANNYTNAEALTASQNIKGIELIPENDGNYKKMCEYEEYLLEKGFDVNRKYFEYKKSKRFALALKVIAVDYGRQKERESLTSQEISNILNEIKKSALKLKNYFFENKSEYSSETYFMINDGLSLCEKISDKKLENKIKAAKDIIEEIEYLKNNKDTIENLKILIEEFDESETDNIAKAAYLGLSVDELRNNINLDDFEKLGVNRATWKEITDSRKEDILVLLDNWSKINNSVTVYEELQKQDKYSDVSELLIEMSKSLARICSLYITNDDRKIGSEPFDEWVYNKTIPFVFTTKIKNPKCESLNQPIRIYILTEQMLGSKAYINRIRDYIIEKNYHLNSFSVIFLLGDRDKFNKINTNPITKDLPVLDELALKKIIFATEKKKLPKWEFTYLLVLNKNISDIQPFKSEGSINSEMNIFVGRESIIKEMTSVPKDFAIFGGRQIGKSSLLNEIKHQLILKGYKTFISAFQGYSDSLSVAKGILSELKSEFKEDFDINITTLDEFKILLKKIYTLNRNQPVAIFLDEVDSLIMKENELNEHKLIEIFRDISHETEHRWIFVFAGFKEMYLQIAGKGTTYEGRKNPWANFVDTSAKQLSSIENPESIVNEGLKNILGLEYDQEVSKKIVNYSSSHPAFLQHFCQCLVEHIKNRIDPNNRRIYLEDVDEVFEMKDDFINFVMRTLDMNLSEFQRLLIFLAYDEKVTEFDSDYFEKKLILWVETYIGTDIIIDVKRIKLELELLVITGVIKKSSSNKYKFTHDYYLIILKRIVSIDKDVIENLLKTIFK